MAEPSIVGFLRKVKFGAKLQLVVIDIPTICEVDAPTKLHFAAHHHILYGVIQEVCQRVIALMKVGGKLPIGVPYIQ